MKPSTRIFIALFFGFLFGTLHLIGIGDYVEEVSIDARLRSRPVAPPGEEVRLVAIGDRDVGSEELGQWPFPRAVHGDILRILQVLKAKHVTIDILFTETTQPDQDARLEDVLDGMDNLTLAYYFEGLEMAGGASIPPTEHFLEGRRYGLAVEQSNIIKANTPIPPFTDLEGGFGAVNVQPSRVDELVRKVPLFISHQGRLYPSLAMQTIIQVLGADPDQIRIDPGKAVELIDTKRGNLAIPIDRKGQYRVNFQGSLDHFGESFEYVDLYSAVDDSELATRIGKAVGDRVVLIGNVSTGTSDVVNTPQGRVPGVAVQATVVSNILSGNHLIRLPRWAESGLVFLVTMMFAGLMRPSNAWMNLVIFVVLVGAWVGASFFAIQRQVILPMTPVSASLLGTLLVLLPFQVSTLVGNLAPFIPLPLRRIVLENRPLPSSTSRRELTVFFSDLRGFTEWTEHQEPDEVALALNEYLTAMTEVVEKHGGTLDKFIGDCVMVFFNAPDKRPDHALAAVRMAWDMQRRIDELAETWKAAGREALSAGMGIHTEWVTVGNFGSIRFQDYTVIGRGVNLAARIESSTPGKKILLSAKTNALVQGEVETRLFAELKLKGIAAPVPVYEVLNNAVNDPGGEEKDTRLFSFTEDAKVCGPFPEEGIDVMVKCGRISSETELVEGSQESSP